MLFVPAGGVGETIVQTAFQVWQAGFHRPAVAGRLPNRPGPFDHQIFDVGLEFQTHPADVVLPIHEPVLRFHERQVLVLGRHQHFVEEALGVLQGEERIHVAGQVLFPELVALHFMHVIADPGRIGLKMSAPVSMDRAIAGDGGPQQAKQVGIGPGIEARISLQRDGDRPDFPSLAFQEQFLWPLRTAQDDLHGHARRDRQSLAAGRHNE